MSTEKFRENVNAVSAARGAPGPQGNPRDKRHAVTVARRSARVTLGAGVVIDFVTPTRVPPGRRKSRPRFGRSSGRWRPPAYAGAGPLFSAGWSRAAPRRARTLWRNHRLRACLALPKETSGVWAHMLFDVVERELALPRPPAGGYLRDGTTSLRYERGWAVKPMQSFVAAVGRRGALFVLSQGLYE